MAKGQDKGKDKGKDKTKPKLTTKEKQEKKKEKTIALILNLFSILLFSAIVLVVIEPNELLNIPSIIVIVFLIIANCPNDSCDSILAAKIFAKNIASLPIEFPIRSQRLLLSIFFSKFMILYFHY